MGSLFEQSIFLFYDAVILRFMEKKGLNSNEMYGNDKFGMKSLSYL